MSELKPCPFCGSSNVNEIDMQAVCQNCHVINGDPADFDFPSIPAWNTRPFEDALQARITELEAAQRWIPCSERLPKVEPFELVDVIAVNMNEKEPYAFQTSYDLTAGFEYLNVTHWIDIQAFIKSLTLPTESS
jgi:hypothetical protein